MTSHGEDRALRATSGRAIAAFRCGVALTMALGAPALAGDDDGPELTRPSDLPALPAPITSTPARPAASANGRAVLAVPGLGTARPAAAPAPATSAEALPSLTLDAPLEMPISGPASRPALAPLPGRSSSTRTLEPSTLESETILDERPRGMGSPAGRTIDPLPDSSPARPGPAPGQPARRNRLFGLLPSQTPAPASARTVARPTTGGPSGSATASDSRADPVLDSALRRRIEGQAKASLGDRARSVEVRVVGKTATIQARGVKFYQKRGVRKSLESLPAITGVRTTIEVND